MVNHGEPFRPVILVVVNVGLEVHGNMLVNNLHLSVHLRVAGGGQLEGHTKNSTKSLPKG